MAAARSLRCEVGLYAFKMTACEGELWFLLQPVHHLPQPVPVGRCREKMHFQERLMSSQSPIPSYPILSAEPTR